jgi:DNA polymerase-3 subunit gamma/tau
MELYRKYRPLTFDQVIGQNHITGTLINQVEKKRVGHAYLFTGTRGTGKTTCAKILARAINCLNPQNGSPCGECEVCKSLSKGGNLDVIEMDAASNNGVDSVRDIIEQIKYPPL